MEETLTSPRMEKIDFINFLEIISYKNLNGIIKIKDLFNFFFGANFTQSIAKFLGLFSLLIYILGLVQWSIIKLPKNGRNSCFSENGRN